MKKLLITLVVLTFGGVAQANLLYNGDFTIEGTDALNADGWSEWNSSGWTNREIAANGTYGDPNNLHYAIGANGAINDGIWQNVTVPDNGATYELSADIAMDNWWKPDGYVKLEFYDVTDTQIGFDETWLYANGYDGDVNQPWQPISISAAAPAGTVTVRAVLAGWTAGDGGTIRFDNAVLTPEPASLVLFAGGALLLAGRRRA